MGLHAENLRFEPFDARIEFIQRIAVQAFAGKEAGVVASCPRSPLWSIIVVHCSATSDALPLLSTSAASNSHGGHIATGGQMTAKLPHAMTAIGFDAPGGPDVLRAQELPVPEPGPGEVLIRVAFAGVNRPDIVQRQGNYPPPPGASPIPGLEIAGEVAALGSGVDAQWLGRTVCALVSGGGYAQYCLAKVDHCLPVSEDMSLAEAAAMPETLFTVWHNVFERGWARDGETILVHGGTSGIGTMAILLSRAFGIDIIVTCGSDEKCAKAREIGATHAINYKTQDFVAEVKSITGGKGVDLVLDMVAGDYVQRNLKCLAEDGRHVTIAVQGGVKAELNMAVIMARRYTLTGSTLRPRSNAFKALLAQEIARNVWPLALKGALRPVMDRSFPLREAAAAHARMEAGEHIGKIVLEM